MVVVGLAGAAVDSVGASGVPLLTGSGAGGGATWVTGAGAGGGVSDPAARAIACGRGASMSRGGRIGARGAGGEAGASRGGSSWVSSVTSSTGRTGGAHPGGSPTVPPNPAAGPPHRGQDRTARRGAPRPRNRT